MKHQSDCIYSKSLRLFDLIVLFCISMKRMGASWGGIMET